ncbi:hypothetical protein M0811_01312 [Anaeramoeba ignava]|uniref:TLDc domain-containing protein n=1 Tax=Anaeramoeba ignava TaxID=1746090 RepID=A0A9Q0RAA6_ANAIG|nr:hypothetical protein M0811_01312 [Anaeramoeba ignava]
MIKNFDKLIQQENITKLTKEQLIYILEKGTNIWSNLGIELFEMIQKWGKEKIKAIPDEIDEITKSETLSKMIKEFILKININSIEDEALKKVQKFGFLPDIFLVGIEHLRIQRIEQQKKLEKIQQEKNQELQKIQQTIQEKDQTIQEKDQKIEKIKSEHELQKPFTQSTIIEKIKFMKKLKQWISDDEFFNKMKIGFSAKNYGFSAQTFHSKTDNKGKTLIIIKTTDNYIFGGFTKVGFKSSYSSGSYISDKDAFIFSLENSKKPPQKFPIKNGSEGNAIHYNTSYGPVFGGGHDFYLGSNLQPGYSNFGHAYQLPQGINYNTNESKSYLAGSYSNWQVSEVECYFI